MALVVKNPLANARDIRDAGQSLGWEDALEEGVASHSSFLAGRIPWTEEHEDRGAIVHRVAKSQT